MAFRYPFAFPPQGAVLFLLAALYVLPGLIGHDPWKSDDVAQIAAAAALLREGHWLTPLLPGTATPLPPLFPWLGALSAKLLPFLSVHDAARLPTGLATAAAFLLLGLAAGELHGRQHRAAATLVALGTLGFLAHSHEAQPAMLLFLGECAILWGVAALPVRPGGGRLAIALGLPCAFLSSGLAGLALVLPLPFLALALPAWRRARPGAGLLFALSLGLALCALWPLALAMLDPPGLARWWRAEAGALLSSPPSRGRNLTDYLALLAWFAWPAWPLALWALWRGRRGLAQPGLVLPLAAAVLILVLSVFFLEARNPNALPLLAPLILLATPAAGSLRRGAANAFDWFAMMSFSLAAALVWIGWLAMTAGVPPRIAANAARLMPGFRLDIPPVLVGFAVLLTLAWAWLILASPRRSPWRGTTHWAAGVVALWCLIMALWLPAIDFSKTYRYMAQDLSRHLPPPPVCVAARNLGTAQFASLYYFTGLSPRAEADCDWLLVQGTGPEGQSLPGWQKAWSGRRASDRHELFTLYRRDVFPAPRTNP